MYRTLCLVFGLTVSLLLVSGGCSYLANNAESSADAEAQDDSASDSDDGGRPRGSQVAASPLGTPKDVISHQYVLLRAGRTEELRQLFTEDVRDEITEEFVEKLRKTMEPVSIDQLVHEVIEEQDGDRVAVLIKSRDGTELTRLIRHGAVWKADRLWFK